jgi:hypothetical protein
MAHGACALNQFFRTIPVGCQAGELLDSRDMAMAFEGHAFMEEQHIDSVQYMTVGQWKMMFPNDEEQRDYWDVQAV